MHTFVYGTPVILLLQILPSAGLDPEQDWPFQAADGVDVVGHESKLQSLAQAASGTLVLTWFAAAISLLPSSFIY